MNRLCLIIPTLSSGGAERVMSLIANQWSNEGIDVHLILLAKAQKFYQVDSKVTIHQLGFENNGGKKEKVLSEIKTCIKLRRKLRELSPDAVLSFMTKYNGFTLMASLGLGLHVYVSDRSNPYKKLPLLDHQLRKLLYPMAKGIIAQTNEAKKVLITETDHKNIHVIPNPVRDVKLFPDVQREKIIINMGRMVSEKGQKYLLQAFSRIQSSNWKLVILGDGPLRCNLEKYIDELEITDKVILAGLVSNVDEWLARSSIFVFSSVSEGFPNAILEAMSAGLPCISFDCPVGPSDIIKNGKNGFLVEQKDVTGLSDRMKLLIENEALREKIKENIELEGYRKKYISDQFLKFMNLRSAQ